MNDYKAICQRFTAIGSDTEEAFDFLSRIPLAIPAYREGGAATGVGERQRGEAQRALVDCLRVVPGPLRVWLDADEVLSGELVAEETLASWSSFSEKRKLPLDFQVDPRPSRGLEFGLSSPDDAVREHGIDKVRAIRRIAAQCGAAQGSPALVRIVVGDGLPRTSDRLLYRDRLAEALDTIVGEQLDYAHVIDAIQMRETTRAEGAFAVASPEFSMGYACSRQKLIAYAVGDDRGARETADRISGTTLWLPEMALVIAAGATGTSERPGPELVELMSEIVRCRAMLRTKLILDADDSGIALVDAALNIRKALLAAFLEPQVEIRRLLEKGDWEGGLAVLEKARGIPLEAVWEEYYRRALSSYQIDGE